MMKGTTCVMEVNGTPIMNRMPHPTMILKKTEHTAPKPRIHLEWTQFLRKKTRPVKMDMTTKIIGTKGMSVTIARPNSSSKDRSAMASNRYIFPASLTHRSCSASTFSNMASSRSKAASFSGKATDKTKASADVSRLV